MQVALLVVGVLNLALLARIFLKLDALAPRIWSIAKQERAREEARGLTHLQEATATRVGEMTAALRHHEEVLAERARVQVVEAQARAALAQRRASHVDRTLEISGSLVKDLRLALDAAEGLRASKGTAPSTEPAVSTAAPSLATPPPAQWSPEEEDDEELTRLATRPVELGEGGA